MTIRERMKRRAGFAGIAAAAFFMGLSPLLRYASLLGWIVALVFVVAATFVTIWTLTRMFRCPRCKRRLGAAAREALKDRPANCPNCRVSVDEPVEAHR